MVAMSFSICGSMVMALGKTMISIFLGRFLMGFGWGIDGPIIGKIALLRQEDAGMYIPLLLVMRQVGVICGPFVIFWTKTWNFNFGGTLIDEMNSASLLISFLWIIVFGLNIYATCYEPVIITEEEKEKMKTGSNQETTQLTGSNQDKTGIEPAEQIIQKPSYKYIQVKPLPALTEQIVVCMVSSLSAYILQSTLEAMVTPLTRRLLGWGQTENAIFFIGVGITAVIGYLSVTVSDSSLIN
jgi:ceroid-lipofuscinosis MFS transporter 7